jgi:hypothetical protein
MPYQPADKKKKKNKSGGSGMIEKLKDELIRRIAMYHYLDKFDLNKTINLIDTVYREIKAREEGVKE